MKRVLIVSFDFPPQGGTGAIRVTKFAKYLPEFGWQPVVVASDTLWNPDESLARDVAGVPVYRVGWPRWVSKLWPQQPSLSNKSGTVSSAQPKRTCFRSKLASLVREWLIPDPNVFWVAGALRQCRKILMEEDIAAIFTTSPPHSVQLVGYFLKRRFPHIPWIADLRDLWSQSHLVVDKKLLYPMNYLLEKRCLKRADRALVVTEGIRQLTLEKFPRDVISEARLITLTNGYDPADMALLPAVQPDDRLTLTFTGTLYEVRSQTEFIPALEELMADEKWRDRIRVRLVGFIPASIQRQMQKLCEWGVGVVRPPVPRQEALAEMAQADALILLEADIPELRLNHSNKLFEYLATGKPILAIVPNGEAARLIQEENAGIVVHPNDREGIKRAILQLYDNVEPGGEASVPNPARYARYQRRNLSASLARILDQCVAEADAR